MSSTPLEPGTDSAVGPPGGARPGIHERAVVGVFWAAAQKWLVRISSLLAFVLLGRLLSPQEFGVVALAMAVITMLATISDAGFTPWVIQKRGLTPRAASTAFWISTGIGTVLAVALAALAVPVADLFDSPELRLVLPVLAGTLVITGLSGVPAALLQRDLRFKELAVRQVVATVLSIVVAVVLAVAGAGVWALVAQTVVRVVVACVILFWAGDFRPRFTFSRPDAADMLGYGSRSLGVTLGGAARQSGEPFLVGAVLGTVALGYWTVAGRLASTVVDLCSAAIGSVAGPVFSELQDEPERLGRTFARLLSVGGLVLVPVMTAMALVSADLVPLLFGAQWAVSAGVASILAATWLFAGLANLQRNLLLGTGRAGRELTLTMGALVGQLGLVVLLGQWGLTAIAVGLSVWGGLVFAVRGAVIARDLGVGMSAYTQLLAVGLAAGLAAGAVLAVVLGRDLEGAARLAVVALLGGAVFTGAAVLLARPTVDDLRSSVGTVLARRRRRGATAAAGGTVPG